MDNYNQSTIINKPEIYKDKWLKFDKTVLYPMEINDCNDTIDGVCFKNLSFDECTEKCVGDCDFGYYIQTNNENICVPIRSKVNIDSNPSFRLRNQNIYNFRDDVSITYFQNKDLYPYPPSNAYVYYNSRINIREYNNKNSYMTVDITKNNSDVTMSENGTVMILQPKIINTFIDNSTKIKYNQHLSIHIPVTSLIMRENENQKIAFNILDSEIKNKYQTFAPRRLFYFENINNSNYVKWFEPFYIKTLRNEYLTNKNNKISVCTEKENATIFCLIPQLIPYYCNNGNCENTNIENVSMNYRKDSLEMKDSNGNINTVYFNDNCWGNCNNIKSSVNNNSNKNNIIFIISISFVFFIIISIIILLVLKNHE